MYTLYQTFENIVAAGISHTRSNGELVKVLKKEDADFVWHVVKENSIAGDHYFFILEYEKGDIITIENYMGKSWYMVLGNINDNDLMNITYHLNLFCETWVQQGKAWPKELHNLLKNLLPLVFKYMSNSTLQVNRRLYFEKYSWILERMGKSINQYVKRCIIDEYAASMIECYELAAVEALLKEKGVKICDENVLDFTRAKRDLHETIEIAKKLVVDKNFDSTEKTPCGKIGVQITLRHGFNVMLYLNGMDDSMKTMIDITDECQEFAEFYESI